VSVIDQASMRVIATYPVGREPQHVVRAYDLGTLYVTADYVPSTGGRGAGGLTPINPLTGTPGRPIPVDDPYNLYFTPNGRFAIVVAEARRRLDFYDPHTWQRKHSRARLRRSGSPRLQRGRGAGSARRRAEAATMRSEVIVFRPLIGRSRALSRPWSASTTLSAYCCSTCRAAGANSSITGG
jgi:DNA-binding beta-propeller fold protein YncE